ERVDAARAGGNDRPARHLRLYGGYDADGEAAARAGRAHRRYPGDNCQWAARGRARRCRRTVETNAGFQGVDQGSAAMTALFIRRPVMTALVMIGILFFGAVSYTRLAVSDLPTVDFPTIQVNANLPGASPETMAAAVATPLEKQFSTIAGIDNMTSSSGLGSTSITIQFSLDR